MLEEGYDVSITIYNELEPAGGQELSNMSLGKLAIHLYL